MDNLFNSGLSIEKLAAFLDGNLPASEMQGVSSMIEGNASLQKFMSVSSVIDDSISAFPLSGIELPQELQTLDFELPSLDNDFHGLVPLSPEPSPFLNDMMAAICTDAPVGDTIHQVESDEHAITAEPLDNPDEQIAALSDDAVSTETDNMFDCSQGDL